MRAELDDGRPRSADSGELGAFFAHSPVLACVADDTGNLLHVGGNWTDLLGWTPAELRAQPFFAFVHPDDMAATHDELLGLTNGRPSVGFVNRYRTADGDWVWLRWHAHPVGPSEIFAIAWDVTTEVRQAEELERRNAFLELLARFQQMSHDADDLSDAFDDCVGGLRAFAACDDVVVGVRATDPTGRPVIEVLASTDGFGDTTDATWVRSDGSTVRAVTNQVAALAQATYTGRPAIAVEPEATDGTTGDPPRTRTLAVPIGSGDEVVGAVAFRWATAPAGPESDDRALAARDTALIGSILPLTGAFASAVRRRRAERDRDDLSTEYTKLAATFGAAVRTTRTGVVIIDRFGRVFAVNPAFASLSGHDEGRFVGMSPVCFLDHAEVEEAVRALTGRSTDSFGGIEPAFGNWLCDVGDDTREWSIVRPDGTATAVQLTVGPIESDGRKDGWVMTAFPLEDRVRSEEERTHAALLEQQIAGLRRREERRRLLVEATVYVLASSSLRDALAVVDGYVPLVTGRPGASLVVTDAAGSSDAGAIDADDCWALRSAQRHVSAVGHATRCAHLPADGTWACLPLESGGRQIGVFVVPLPDPDTDTVVDGDGDGHSRADVHGAGVDEILADAADAARQFGMMLANVRLRLSLQARAVTDPLTHVGNRRAGEDALREVLAETCTAKRPFGVLMLDVDDFKAFNDAPGRGHEVGDAVLVGIARLLRDVVPAGGDVARMGGDEFMIVLRDVDASTCRAFAEEIVHRVRDADLSGDGGSCTVSVGALHVADPCVDRDRVVAAADAALYRAKDGGRDSVVFVQLDGSGTVDDEGGPQ